MNNGKRGKETMAARPAQYQTAAVNEKLIINLRDLGHILRSLYEGKSSQRRILILLKETGGMTQRDLTQRLGIQPASVSEVIAKLERSELITRTKHADDRRTADIRLTERGEAAAFQAAVRRGQRHEAMFACLTDEEKRTLLSLMEKIYTDWQSHYLEKNEEEEETCGNT